MKKLIIAIIVLASAQNAFSQNINKNSNSNTSVSKNAKSNQASFFQIGPVAGVSSSNWDGVQAKTGKLEPLTGTTVGAQILLGRDQLQFETGVYQSERGTKLIGALNNNLDIDYKFKYIDIPALAKYSFQQRQQTAFFVKGGLVLGLLQSAEASGEFKGLGPFSTKNLKDQFNSNDPRYALAAGVDLRLSKSMAMMFELNYQLSTGAINKEKGTENIEIFNSSAALNAGLSFDL